jgi:hypothetical protein
MPICFKRVFQDHVEQRREVCSLFHRFPAGWHGERLCVLLFGSEAHFFVKQQALKDLSGTLGTRTRRRIFAQGNVVCSRRRWTVPTEQYSSRLKNTKCLPYGYVLLPSMHHPALVLREKGRVEGCMYRVPRHLRRYVQVVCGYKDTRDTRDTP